MKTKPVFTYRRLAVVLAAAFALPLADVLAVDYAVSTLAGSGHPTARDGLGTIGVKFLAPSGVAIDSAGNLYVADTNNNLIRKITAAGQVTTLAGDGSAGFADGSGTAARFNAPKAVAVDSSGTVYVADTMNNRVRMLTPAGVVSTLAGGASAGAAGYADGTGIAAQFSNPAGVAVDGSGNLIVSDRSGHRIRRIDSSGVVTTLAGSGTPTFLDGTGTGASFNFPTGVAITPAGDIVVADSANHRIRKITAAGVVSTVAGDGTASYFDGTGTASAFNSPAGVVVDSTGNIYVADSINQRIRRIDIAGVLSTPAGSITAGNIDGSGSGAQFSFPTSLALDGVGNIFVADTNNNLIRKVNNLNSTSAFAGSNVSFLDGTGVLSEFSNPYGIARDGSGNLYIADSNNHMIRMVTLAGVVTTLAGDGKPGYLDGIGTASKFNNPTSVAVDGSGNIFIADQNNHRIRKISAGVVSTLAGDGTANFANGLTTAAQFNNPSGVALDVSGNLYVADFSNNRIRVIDTVGAVTSLAGDGVSGYVNGSGAAARFYNPNGLAVDSYGTIVVADRGNNCLRSITPAGVVSTLAGSCVSGSPGSADGSGSSASFNLPNGVAIDGSGNVYVADSTNSRIRRVTTGGVVSTLAGSSSGYIDATGIAAKFANPAGIVVDSFGQLFVADTNNHRIRQMLPTLSAPVFNSVSSANLATQISSNSYTVSGASGTVTGSIACPANDSGCGYSINGGSFISTPATVNNGDVLVVRLTSSASYSSTVQATLTVGTAQGTFSVTTTAAPVVDPGPLPPPPVVIPPVIIPPLPPSVSITPVTDPSTIFTGSTGATVDPTTGVVVLSSTSTTPVTLSNTAPDNVGIKPATNVPVTFTNSQGNSVTITGLTGDTLLVTRKVGSTTLIEVASGTARIEPSSTTSIPLLSKTDNSTATLSPGPNAAATSVVVRRNDTGIAAFIETGSTVYKSVDSHGNSTPDATVYSGETANFSNQGNVDQVKLGSLDGDRNLPGDPIKNIPNVDPGLIVPQLGGNVARLGGESILDSLKNQIDAALGSPPGAEVSFDPASGVVVYKLNGVEARFIPLGNLLISLTGFADNGFVATNAGQTASGTFKLVDRGVQLTLASTLGYFTDFDAAVKASDPTGKVTLKASGALWIDLLGSQYITQPGYLAQSSGIAGKPNVYFGSDGQLSFRDSKGGVQVLYPTLADAATLQNILASLAPGASVKPQGDGTAAANVLGSDYTLVPQYNLIAVPGKYIMSTWWLDNGTLYYTMPTIGKAQGFTVK